MAIPDYMWDWAMRFLLWVTLCPAKNCYYSEKKKKKQPSMCIERSRVPVRLPTPFILSYLLVPSSCLIGLTQLMLFIVKRPFWQLVLINFESLCIWKPPALNPFLHHHKVYSRNFWLTIRQDGPKIKKVGETLILYNGLFEVFYAHSHINVLLVRNLLGVFRSMY